MLNLPIGAWDGETVRAAREALGLTQQELADALELEGNFGKDSVRNWEREKRPISGPSRVAIRSLLLLKGVALAKPKAKLAAVPTPKPKAKAKPKLAVPFKSATKGVQPRAEPEPPAVVTPSFRTPGA
jgi:transcriptional regulator with XRE-family HTH domain